MEKEKKAALNYLKLVAKSCSYAFIEGYNEAMEDFKQLLNGNFIKNSEELRKIYHKKYLKELKSKLEEVWDETE